ncbi:hypothetical protein EVAR_66232_1 [Eumeta japonica]|uniref:Uncharacterized protein n=1 Tax=Eumeta variegata TaxID=151549 RepID=A0A4C1ZWV4_EUMVA|nr:hypothetical protein EVAR_66232_1 [Eumeta japonica]
MISARANSGAALAAVMISTCFCIAICGVATIERRAEPTCLQAAGSRRESSYKSDYGSDCSRKGCEFHWFCMNNSASPPAPAPPLEVRSTELKRKTESPFKTRWPNLNTFEKGDSCLEKNNDATACIMHTLSIHHDPDPRFPTPYR